MLAAEVVLSLKETLPQIQLVAVVPYRGQSERWTPYEQRRYERLLAVADEVRVLSERYFNGCLLRRNDYMIRRADHIIAYFAYGEDGLRRMQLEQAPLHSACTVFDGKQKGGTFYTVRNATALGLTVTNLYNDSV